MIDHPKPIPSKTVSQFSHSNVFFTAPQPTIHESFTMYQWVAWHVCFIMTLLVIFNCSLPHHHHHHIPHFGLLVSTNFVNRGEKFVKVSAKLASPSCLILLCIIIITSLSSIIILTSISTTINTNTVSYSIISSFSQVHTIVRMAVLCLFTRQLNRNLSYTLQKICLGLRWHVSPLVYDDEPLSNSNCTQCLSLATCRPPLPPGPEPLGKKRLFALCFNNPSI